MPRLSLRGLLGGRKRAAELAPPQMPGGFELVMPTSDIDASPIKTRKQALEAYAGWIFAAASLISEDVRANPWTLWKKTGQRREDWTANDTHALVRTLERPNREQTWGDLIEVIDLHYSLAGQAFLHIITDLGGKPSGLQVLYPHWIEEPVFSEGRWVGWRVMIPGRAPEVLPREDVVRIYRPHPLEPFLAASPVEAMAVSHYFDQYTRAYGASLVRNNGGIPPALLTTDQKLSPKDSDLLRERWKDRYQNTRENIGVLGQGTKFQPISIPIGDINFLELGRFNEKQILGLYRVPSALLGISEDFNRANMEAARQNYQESALRPRLRRYDEVVNVHVKPRFMTPVESRQHYFEFEDPVSENLQDKWEAAGKDLERGAITVDHYREMRGLDPLPNGEGEVFMVPVRSRVVASLKGEAARMDALMSPKADSARALPAPEARESEDAEEALELAALRFLQRQDPLERQTKSEVRAQFSREGQAVAKAYRESQGERSLQRDWLDDTLSAFEEGWQELTTAAWLKGQLEGWGLALEDFGREGVAWSIYEPRATSYAREHAAKAVTGIQDTTRKAVRDVVAQAIEEGATVDETAGRISKLYDDFKGARAQTIARTETAQAVSRGKHEHTAEAQKRFGWTVERTWSATLDDRTRLTHAVAHGQTQQGNLPFLVGGAYLAHPADPNGPASETVNCRCTERIEVIDE